MKTPPEKETHLQPRSCGGWIGVFDDGDLRFGVTAETEAEVRTALAASLVRWRADEEAADWVRQV